MRKIASRKANPSDCEGVFHWRNDALTRAMSHSTDPVDWEDHSNWFAASLQNESRLLVICEEGETPVAVVRFDVSGDRALISINLAPTMRGKGLATPCLTSATAFFASEVSGVAVIDAEIKPENEASKRAFEAAGFSLGKEAGGVLHYAYVL
ncbi:MAG: GNAT family N-acetyltransferase [Pseudomonadota bacterium]